MTESNTTGSPAHVRRVVTLGYAVFIAALAFFALRTKHSDPLLIAASLSVFAFGALPMLWWLKRNDDTYPIIEFFLLTTVPFYAVPVLTNHEALRGYPESIMLQAALVVLTFQLAAIGGSSLAKRSYHPGRRIRSSWWKEAILPDEKLHFTAYTALLNTLYMVISAYTTWIPADWNSTLRAVFFGIGIISIFIQGRLWGARQLSPTLQTLFWVNMAVQITVSFTSLVLINGISLLLTAAIGYFSVARRVPWTPILVMLPIIAVLHNGKAQMRYIYWDQRQPQPKLTDLPAYFTQWTEFGLAAPKDDDEENAEKAGLTYGLMRRASLYHIVCIAVDTMPDRSPFLVGESYSLLPAQLIPRILWPEKPSPQRSVRLLALHFGIQTEEATETTSIGFGMLAEAYANFGYFSVAALGFILGWIFRRLAITTVECATLSPAGLLRILCLVWCLSAETTLAVWFSSFYQAAIAIGVPLMLWKSFFND